MRSGEGPAYRRRSARARRRAPGAPPGARPSRWATAGPGRRQARYQVPVDMGHLVAEELVVHLHRRYTWASARAIQLTSSTSGRARLGTARRAPARASAAPRTPSPGRTGPIKYTRGGVEVGDEVLAPLPPPARTARRRARSPAPREEAAEADQGLLDPREGVRVGEAQIAFRVPPEVHPRRHRHVGRSRISNAKASESPV